MLLKTFLEETVASAQDSSATAASTVIDEFTAETTVFVIVGGLVLLWLVSVGFFLYKMIRRYTLGNWSEENKNPYENETLAMPRGTFRGILTMSLLFIVMILEVVSLKMPIIEFGDKLISLEDKIDQLIIAFQMMLAFYFGSKVMHHVTSADARKTEHVARAAAASRSEPARPGAEFDDAGSVG
ncbi:MAG: hypothetical protein ACE5IY_19620 [bacterium]